MSILKKALITMFSVIAFCVIGYLALVAVYCIPTGEGSAINLRMKQGITHFENETHAYNFMEAPNSEVDLYSDAMYLLEAADAGTGNPFKDAVRNVYKDIEPLEHPIVSLLLQYGDENTNLEIQKQNYEQRRTGFKTMTNSDAPEYNIENSEIQDYIYGRYWHGYLIILKPLLAFFDYGVIRTIIMFVVFALLLFLFWQTYKKFKAAALSIFILIVFLNPVSISLCFMYFPMMVLTLVLCILVVRYNKFFLNEKFKASIVFLLFGCAMYFFDIMTFPFMGFFLPIALLLYSVFWQQKDQKKCLKESFFLTLRYGIFWAGGFLCVFAAKLIILYLVAGAEDFALAMQKVEQWTGDFMVGYFDAVRLIFAAGLQPTITFTTLIIVVYTIYLMIKNKKVYWGVLAVTLILALSPGLIILVLRAHETFHVHYTFRDFAVSWIAIINYCCFYYIMYCKEHKITKFKDTL